MKFSKAHIHRRVYTIPQLRFEDQRLSSFSGLVVIQALLKKLALRARLKRCFHPIPRRPIIGFELTVLLLVVHLMLGYRKLREMERYKDDPLVLRLLGLRRLPDVSTVTRRLSQVDRESVALVRRMNRELVLAPLATAGPARLTMDFDGSVAEYGSVCRRDGRRVQQREKGQTQLLPAVLHDRPNRPGAGPGSSTWECA